MALSWFLACRWNVEPSLHCPLAFIWCHRDSALAKISLSSGRFAMPCFKPNLSADSSSSDSCWDVKFHIVWLGFCMVPSRSVRSRMRSSNFLSCLFWISRRSASFRRLMLHLSTVFLMKVIGVDCVGGDSVGDPLPWPIVDRGVPLYRISSALATAVPWQWILV